MYKTTITIDGMSCGMCESHVNDALRSGLPITKASSSHRKGTAEVISEEPLSLALIRQVLNPTGYKALDAESEPYEKKGFFSRLK